MGGDRFEHAGLLDLGDRIGDEGMVATAQVATDRTITFVSRAGTGGLGAPLHDLHDRIELGE